MTLNQEPRKGFTLVELAIVLVIIGLLIGGILAAQSMIATSRIVAVAAQIQQFDAGVENFKTKYNYLPGDAPAFGGNGNGIIAWTAFAGGALNQTYALNCEIGNFWNNIKPEEYTGSICTWPGVQAIPTGPNKNVPAAKLGKAGSFFIASAMSLGNTYADTANVRNFYAILEGSQGQTNIGFYNFIATTSSNSAVRPIDLLSLDKKIDYGIGNTGDVLSGNLTPSTNAGIFLSPLGTCSNSATGVYSIANTGYTCTPLIRIGAQAGDPQ